MILNANIKSGENSFTKLPDSLKELGFKTPCILVDKNLYENSSYVTKVINNIVPKERFVFYDYPFEPSYQMLDNMMDELNGRDILNHVDVWIGIGGGSTMDTAKGLAILCNNTGSSINYKGFPIEIKKPLPVIAIPSTTGTGSEVVYNASFIDEDSKIKMGINYQYNYPVLAVLDPLVPSTAPMSVLASSGCDALVHTLESFMSKKTNEQIRYFSKRAYCLIMSNMIPILKGEGNLQNWQNMQWAAVYAMFALSNSTSGPTGALSYYLGAHYRVNHGVAGGVFIGKVCQYNHENGYYDLSELYEGVDKNALDKQERSTLIVQEIENILELTNIPKKLDDFGVKTKDLAGFNEFAVQAKTAFDFNPVKIAPDRVAELFVSI